MKQLFFIVLLTLEFAAVASPTPDFICFNEANGDFYDFYSASPTKIYVMGWNNKTIGVIEGLYTKVAYLETLPAKLEYSFYHSESHELIAEVSFETNDNEGKGYISGGNELYCAKSIGDL